MQGSTIILASDLSDGAARAARWAAGLGRLTGLPVVVAHVVEIGFDSWLHSRYAVSLDEARQAEVLNEVSHWYEMATGEPPSGVDVRVDYCVSGLETVAGMYDGALLVMAPSTKGTLAKAVVGSRVQQIASRPPCPLVIVGPDAEALDAPPRIAAATDFSEASFASIDVAGSLAELTGGTLTVVYAFNPPPAPFFRGIDARSDDGGARLQELAGIDLKVLIRERLPGQDRVSARVLAGAPSDQLVEFAREERIDVLVIGQTGHTSAAGDLLGSTPRRIIRNLPCTVVITPAPPRAEVGSS